jgi:CMP-2-keto-3-deoxyoctulosonic acid synthetase
MRLPDKNLMLCAGKPLVQWVADECFKSMYLDAVYHISDSDELKSLLTNCRVIDEPDEIAGDAVPILSVIKYAVGHIDCHDNDFIVWVDVSKPLTKFWHIDKVVRYAAANGLDSVFTTKPLRYYTPDDPAIVTQLRGTRKELYFGAVRLRTAKTIRDAMDGTWGRSDRHADLCICEDFEIDVDYLHDFIMAEALLNAGY